MTPSSFAVQAPSPLLYKIRLLSGESFLSTPPCSEPRWDEHTITLDVRLLSLFLRIQIVLNRYCYQFASPLYPIHMKLTTSSPTARTLYVPSCVEFSPSSKRTLRIPASPLSYMKLCTFYNIGVRMRAASQRYAIDMNTGASKS